jgi:hypothetical protein
MPLNNETPAPKPLTGPPVVTTVRASPELICEVIATNATEEIAHLVAITRKMFALLEPDVVHAVI